MSILKLTPSCKDYLWGGSRLRTDFGVQSDLNPLAEAWVLSCHPDGPSYLPDGIKKQSPFFTGTAFSTSVRVLFRMRSSSSSRLISWSKP